jgi:hypothetical protein
MKKIGILTYFWSDNPGTYLQAYSMLRCLSDKCVGDQVELVDYRHRRVYFRPSCSCVSLRQWYADYKRYTTYREMKKAHFVLSSQHLISRESERAWDFIEKQHYDLVVVGSDTILSLHARHENTDHIPVYWLPPRLACEKVMCAASARAVMYEGLTERQRVAMRESANGFTLLGVRDDATVVLLRRLGLVDESRLQLVPDPTFTFDIPYEQVEGLLRRKGIDPSVPLVGLSLPRFFKGAPALADHYRSKGFRVVSLEPARYADVCLTDISPFEWAGIYKYLRLVITNRFHGTLFSLKNLTPVVSVISDSSLVTADGLSKHYSLLRSFNLHATNYVVARDADCVSEIIHAADRAMHTFDRTYVATRLEGLRSEFYAFVDKLTRVVH